MKKLLPLLLLLPALAFGQCNPFAAQQILTASGLNAALQAGCITSGSINGATIGNTTPSTGAFTTLSASSTVSGTGFSTYLASPPSIGGTAAAAGAFTTLSASGNDAMLYQNSSLQSIPSGANTTVTNWTKVYDRVNANFNASTGVFTAPSTGYYQVSAQLTYASAAGVAGTVVQAIVNVNGAAVATGQTAINNTGTSIMAASVSAVVLVTAGQTIVLQAQQNSGSARALGGALTDFLSISRIP